jgi:hypothetical protein
MGGNIVGEFRRRKGDRLLGTDVSGKSVAVSVISKTVDCGILIGVLVRSPMIVLSDTDAAPNAAIEQGLVGSTRSLEGVKHTVYMSSYTQSICSLTWAVHGYSGGAFRGYRGRHWIRCMIQILDLVGCFGPNNSRPSTFPKRLYLVWLIGVV